jgi:ATP-dependent Clp protease ATP-binding subunit ClpC
LTTVLIITSILLSVAALWVALVRARASSRDRGRETGELREWLGRELSSFRERLESEQQRNERNEARLEALATVQEEVRREFEAAVTERTVAQSIPEFTATDSTPAETPAAETLEEPSDVYVLARGMDEFFSETSHPRELLGHEGFRRGVELSLSEGGTARELLARAAEGNPLLACISLEALARREGDDEEVIEGVLRDINAYFYWPRFYALRALAAHAGTRDMLVPLLARLNSTWREHMPLWALREFIAERIAAGDTVSTRDLTDEAEALKLDSAQWDEVCATIDAIAAQLPAGARAELSQWRVSRQTTEFVKSIGRVWEDEGHEVFMLDSLAARVSELEATVRREPARSVLLVGESGAGKTALVRALAARLRGDGWLVFEAAPAEVLAGQSFIGQIEERVQAIVRQLQDKRVLWVMPNFHEALWAGRHRYSPTGVLDLLLPHIESGAVRLIGEVPARAYEQLVRLRPRLRTSMQTCRVAPLSDDETLELGRRWAERRTKVESASVESETQALSPRASERTLREALQLAKQYLDDKAAPGNLLLLLEATDRRLLAEGRSGDEVKLDDMLVTLSQLTGLPVQILDEREGLDLSELRAFFEKRVLGQPEAVDCLVERVAMIKAGLTDPTRPQGVFLFVGPTGTGKTEIAKTLADFLFGSPERMIRLDMSELQTWESQARILGESDETSDSAALVNQIRKQPFSVVLLDEFEKAHTSVWDLFLQVFDDGRLTDRRGNTADFRHSVIIMTSNLGATLPHGASVGFSQEQAQFAAGSVERAVGRAFRREFVNRIDRVVVFRPLGRAVMRDLLRKELNDVLTRRGLRTRQWAVEWDESAVEFLLEKGFTADLGARPLKRAVERYLLSPLALTIVNHQFPEGDQFLFVRSSPDAQALDVQFVDPDAPAHVEAAVEEVEELSFDEEAAQELRLESVALDPRGAPEELRFLQERFDDVAAQVEDDAWRERKEGALREMQTTDFWSSSERFSVLGAVEYMDRIEAGLDTAGSLLARLRGNRKRLPSDLVARLAEQLYLLDSACRGMAEGHARDAFLLVTAGREPGADRARSDDFARTLARMYRRWAERRRMRLELIEEHDGARANGAGAEEYRALFAVSGYAAYTIIRQEAGLHVLETPQDEKSSF